MREEQTKFWARFESLRKFLRDYYPEVVDNVASCRMSASRIIEHAVHRGYVRVIPRRCRAVPFCPPCVRSRHWERMREAQAQLSRSTPQGRPMRLYHIVMTATLTDEGWGWGKKAAQDIRAFGGVVWGAITEHLGPNLGAIMSYQDFGEQGFAKQHPHMDLTLNGWHIGDGQVKPMPEIDIEGPRKEDFLEAYRKHARTLDIDPYIMGPSIDVRGPGTSHGEYFSQLYYQTRELVDLRKLDYDRARGMTWWIDYKTDERTPLPARDFVNRLDEYARRLGAWQNGAGKLELHKRYGHLAKNRRKEAWKLTGGEAEAHPTDCLCMKCSDYFPLELTEEEYRLNRGGRLDFDDG